MGLGRGKCNGSCFKEGSWAVPLCLKREETWKILVEDRTRRPGVRWGRWPGLVGKWRDLRSLFKLSHSKELPMWPVCLVHSFEDLEQACQKGAELPSLSWVCIGLRTHICPQRTLKRGHCTFEAKHALWELFCCPKVNLWGEHGEGKWRATGSIPGALMVSLPHLREVPSKLNQPKI